MPSYEGARLKIKRANKHITDAEVSIDLLKKGLVVAVHVDANRGNEFIECDFATLADRQSFAELPLIIGDAVHNLKCALDHAWLETVNRLIPSKDWERTKFPCFASRDELEGQLRKLEIDISAPNLFRLLITKVKPYSGGDDYFLRTLHELDKRDKHRLLIPTISYSSIGDIHVKDQSGMLHQGGTWGTTDPFPYFLEFASGLHVENPGKPSFQIMFKYGDRGGEARAVDMLRLLLESVSLVVEMLDALLDP